MPVTDIGPCGCCGSSSSSGCSCYATFADLPTDATCDDSASAVTVDFSALDACLGTSYGTVVLSNDNNCFTIQAGGNAGNIYTYSDGTIEVELMFNPSIPGGGVVPNPGSYELSVTGTGHASGIWTGYKGGTDPTGDYRCSTDVGDGGDCVGTVCVVTVR